MISKVENLKSPVPKDQVRVKIMRWVGEFQPGDIVDCDQASADSLCKVGQVHNGNGLEPVVRAMLLEEADALDISSQDIKKMTQAEMAKYGKKNIVQSPKYADLEKKFNALKAQNDKDNAEVEADKAVAKKVAKAAPKEEKKEE